ncbi:MAG: hypothetical protein LBP83_01965 [Dysgonamonadaceae bacterium]|jgi:hypothetical protein|nr:hypothetical protein [Dysgonamonadaceae bacterium]
MENNYYGPQISLPYSTAILVLGIISIAMCWCYGIPTLVCSIIALVLSGSASKKYKAEPANYTESSYKNATAGKICAIIGLVLSVLFIIYLIFVIAIIGWETFQDPAAIQEWIRDYQS